MSKCVKCGALHGMVLEDREGNCEPLDLCYDCIFANCKFVPPEKQISFEETIEEMKKNYEEKRTNVNEEDSEKK